MTRFSTRRARRRCCRKLSGTTCSWYRWTGRAAGTATTSCSQNCSRCTAQNLTSFPSCIDGPPDWFRTAGLVDDAVHHLTSAGDIAAAKDLIAAKWTAEINVGRLATVSGWLDLLPRSVVSADPRLGIARAWIALDTGHIEHADAWIDATEDALAASSSRCRHAPGRTRGPTRGIPIQDRRHRGESEPGAPSGRP